PVLTNVRATFNGLDVYDVEPRQLPDVLGERPVIVFGKWRETAEGGAKGGVTIEGRSATGPWKQQIRIDGDTPRSTPALRAGQGNAALRALWARHRIAALSDQEALQAGDDLRQAITDLGLKYSLLTQYTSFIAVDQVVRNTTGAAAGVNQPLPLPQGVGENALGAEVPSTPEPETLGAVAVALSVLLMLRRRARRHDARKLTA
ncbi:MAG: PEP-CTERM sorting domain-containing protein, partial [Comamonadaceae bacterium]